MKPSIPSTQTSMLATSAAHEQRVRCADGSHDEPRTGFKGALDRLVGPGATGAELALQGVIPVLAMACVLGDTLRAGLGWTPTQYVVATLLAFDLSGGIVTNATSSAKRWYHRPSQKARHHFAFVALHLLHLALVCWLFLDGDGRWFLTTGGALMLSATLVIVSPLYLKRPVAYTLYACLLVATIYGLAFPKGLEWFLPLFYLKLLVSHLPPETPFRPAPQVPESTVGLQAGVRANPSDSSD